MLYVLIGFAAGIISGMGIGGGTILIPALFIFFHTEQRAAQNINLIFFIPTAIIALITHIKNKAVEREHLCMIILSGIAGAAAGALIATRIEQDYLRKMFGGFLMLMGLWEIFKKKQSKNGEDSKCGSQNSNH